MVPKSLVGVLIVWMRRTGIAAIVAGLVVLIGAPPAFAVQPPPPPVDDLPMLSSTVAKMSQGTDGTWAMRTLNAMAAANRGSAVATIAKPVPMPITPPAALSRVGLAGAGGVLTLAFQAGWTITDGTLALYGQQTGSNPLQSTCGWDAVGQAIVTTLYPLSSPDCTISANVPNADIIPGWSTISHGSWTAAYKKTQTITGDNNHWFTQTIAGSTAVTGARGVGSAFALYVQNSSGAWQLVQPAYAASSVYNSKLPDIATGDPQLAGINAWIRNVGKPPAVQVRNVATQAVVAENSATNNDPARRMRCDLKWPDGSTTTWNADTTYLESAGLPLKSINTTCQQAFVSKPGAGPDLLPSEIKIGSVNTETGAQTEISKQTVPDFDATQKKGLTPGANGGLRLLKVVGNLVDSCMTWAADCANWWADSQNGTNEETYRCVFAGQPVSLAECGPYRHTFDTKTSTPTVTDPATGNETEWVTRPGIGNSTSPGAPGDVSPGSTCMSEWGSAPNPLEWVFHPVKCAMVWAFVPRQSVVTATVTSLGAAAGSVAAVDPLLTLIDQLPQSSGCNGIPFTLSFFGQSFEGRLLDACTGEVRAVATVVNGLLALVIITSSVIAIIRFGAALFGFVGPGGSMEQTSRATERAEDWMNRRSSGGGGG